MVGRKFSLWVYTFWWDIPVNLVRGMLGLIENE